MHGMHGMHDAERLELHAGPLRFSAYASGEGPLVVCLHGFPDQPRSFRHQLPALVDAGYRVVVPTLRGYEPSSQPANGHYYVLDLAEDLLAWIDELGADQVRVVGHDWGAIIAYAAAALAPTRIRCMVTIAVPHMRRFTPSMPMVSTVMPAQLRRSWYVLLFQLRGLSDVVFARHSDRILDKLWRDWSPGWTPEPGELDAVKATFALPGVRRAAMQYYRALFGSPTRRSRESWKLLAAKTPVPTLAITGALDGAVDSRLHDLGNWQNDYLAPSRVLRFERAGHFVHQERPNEVNAAILEWLRAHEDR
jgi:pimeloyl-ACP methyl ester carboxylesterase